MANDKDIKFNIKAGLDSSALDRQINQIKQKLQSLTQNQGYSEKAKQLFGDSSPMGQAAARVFQRERQADIRQLTSEYGSMEKVVQKIEKRMEAIKKQMEGQTDEAKKQSQIQLDNMTRQQASIRRGQTDIAGTLQGQGLDPQGRPIPQGPAPTLGDRMRGFLTPQGMGAALMKFGGAAAAGTSVYGQYLGIQQTRDREVLANLGRTTQGANIGFQDTMAGRGYSKFFEQGERRGALDVALGERERRMEKDMVQTIGRALTKTVGGTTAGGIGGSFIPGLGTAVGALGGGLFGLGSELFGNKGSFRRMFDRDAYMSEVNAETMQNFRGNLMAAKLADPTKFAAEQVFGKNQGAFQRLQRQLGFSDADLFGGQVEGIPTRRLTEDQMTSSQRARGRTRFNPQTGKYEITESDADFQSRQDEVRARNANRQQGFLEQQMMGPDGRPMFSQERIMQNITSILGAGGTSAFARGGGANLAARFQQAGMTGAAGELGALSGLGGNTEESYKRILSEAMTIGIDASEMKEEMRQFSKAAVQIMMRTEGAEGAVSQFASGMVGTSAVAMQAAQNAFQGLNQESGQGGGYRGALKWAYLNSQEGQEIFKAGQAKVASGQMTQQQLEDIKGYMTSANLENLDPDDPMLKYAAQALGKSPEEIMGDISKVQKSGLNYSERADTLSKNFNQSYQKFLKENKMEDTAQSREAFMATDQGIQSFGRAFGAVASERGDQFSQQGGRSKAAAMFMRTGQMDFTQGPGKQFELPEGTPDTIADKGEASRAKDQVAQLSVLNEKIGELGDAMSKNRNESLENTKAIQINSEMTKALTEFLKTGGTSTENLLETLKRSVGIGGEEQPTAGKPK